MKRLGVASALALGCLGLASGCTNLDPCREGLLSRLGFGGHRGECCECAETGLVHDCPCPAAPCCPSCQQGPVVEEPGGVAVPPGGVLPPGAVTPPPPVAPMPRINPLAQPTPANPSSVIKDKDAAK
jgi:hypothetical protein